MKKIIVALAVLSAAFSAFAQPGFGGGFGGGMPMGGPGMGMGPGMGPGMGGFDIFANTREDIADAAVEELTELLGLSKSQAKKVFIIYTHSDSGIMQEMTEKMEEIRKEREANMTEEEKAQRDAQREEMRKKMAEDGMGFGGFGGGMPKFEDMEQPEAPKVIPLSKKEKAYREKMMKRVLDEGQYAKWLEYEAAQPEANLEDFFSKMPPMFRR